MAPQSGGLIFPIGHYLGPFHAARASTRRVYVVRVGWETPKLPNDDHLKIWFLAHRQNEPSGGWTRRKLAGAARVEGVTDAETRIDTLLRLGLLAQVDASASGAIEFARTYRMCALLAGIGDLPDEPALNGIGMPGLPPLLKVPPPVFEVWQWAHLWPTMWSACEGLAQAAGSGGQVDPRASQPRHVLGAMLDAVGTLLANHAIYLDRATAATS